MVRSTVNCNTQSAGSSFDCFSVFQCLAQRCRASLNTAAKITWDANNAKNVHTCPSRVLNYIKWCQT